MIVLTTGVPTSGATGHHVAEWIVLAVACVAQPLQSRGCS
jgi:hypothetical protein